MRQAEPGEQIQMRRQLEIAGLFRIYEYRQAQHEEGQAIEEEYCFHLCTPVLML